LYFGEEGFWIYNHPVKQCSGIDLLDMRKWNTWGVPQINRLFYFCGGASCCVTYTYTSQIYPRSQLIIFISLFYSEQTEQTE
jgi:hypothetical protein